MAVCSDLMCFRKILVFRTLEVRHSMGVWGVCEGGGGLIEEMVEARCLLVSIEDCQISYCFSLERKITVPITLHGMNFPLHVFSS